MLAHRLRQPRSRHTFNVGQKIMLSGILEQFIAVLPIISEYRKQKREEADSALRAISYALNETYIYYRRYPKSGRNRDTEEQLSRYWSAAAIPLRHIDESLALICENKSEYWLNPENYNDEDIRKYGIGLDSVRRRYRMRLAPGLRLSSKNKK
jgi:hypothetical protein